ncbi:MAG: phosphoribosylformylglycinamidine synthase subunit PurQ [Deltaproteobacteria bacterium]|nr:phosphoribosylformylglycinamidine synthase subunit PurQ [Deltaproteobacteria bacterium]
MRKRVKTIVITGYGTNCEIECAHACRLAGSDEVDIIHMSDLLYGDVRLDKYHFLNLPGGFLDGDDLGSAKAGVNRIRYAKIKGSHERLYDQFYQFIKEGKLILGICNGFQLLVKLGFLPGFDGDYNTPKATLTFNDSGKFEDRWVYLRIDRKSPCVYTKGQRGLYLPVRHGEGKFIVDSDVVLERLQKDHLIALQYSHDNYQNMTMDYPANPNGSVRGIAGICNETGRVFGLMPHPEAFLHFTNHPRWTREKLPVDGQGLSIFKNAVQSIRNSEF